MPIEKKMGGGGHQQEYSTEDGKFVDENSSTSSNSEERQTAAELLGLAPKSIQSGNEEEVAQLFDVPTISSSKKNLFDLNSIRNTVMKNEEEGLKALYSMFPDFVEKNVSSIYSVPRTFSNGVEFKTTWDYTNQELFNMQKQFEELVGEDRFRDIEEKAKRETSEIKTVDRMNMREQIIDDEIDEQERLLARKGISMQNGRKAVIVLGLPGSGKSTIANPLMEKYGAYVIDADNMKKRIPEFREDPNMIDAVHDESVDCANKMLEKSMQKGSNVIIGKVGGYTAGIIEQIKKLKDSGYEVGVILNVVALETSLDRVNSRYQKGESSRIVPPAIAFDSDINMHTTYDLCCNIPGVSCAMYSNEVEKGQKPELLRKDGKDADKLLI